MQLLSSCQRQVNHRIPKMFLWRQKFRASLCKMGVPEQRGYYHWSYTWTHFWHDSCDWNHLANCALQGYYTASSCNSLPTFWDDPSVSHLQGSIIILFLWFLYNNLSTAIDQNSCLCECNCAATADSSLCSICHMTLANQCNHSSDYTEYPTHYRTRNFFNNSNTNDDMAKKFEQEYVRCVRNEKECVCSAPNCCDTEQRSAS